MFRNKLFMQNEIFSSFSIKLRFRHCHGQLSKMIWSWSLVIDWHYTGSSFCSIHSGFEWSCFISLEDIWWTGCNFDPSNTGLKCMKQAFWNVICVVWVRTQNLMIHSTFRPSNMFNLYLVFLYQTTKNVKRALKWSLCKISYVFA